MSSLINCTEESREVQATGTQVRSIAPSTFLRIETKQSVNQMANHREPLTAQLKPTRPIQSSTVSSSNNLCSNEKGEMQTLQNREYKLLCEHNNNFHGLPRSSADERQPVASSAIIQKKRPTQLKRWQSVNTHSDMAKGLNSGVKLLQKGGSSSDQNNDRVVAKTASGNCNFNSPQHLSGLVVSES